MILFYTSKRLTAIFSLLLLMGYGCKKFVQIGAPNTQLVTPSVFDNNEAATSALTSIYAQMHQGQESYLLSSISGLLADELIPYSLNQVVIVPYQNSMTANGTNGSRWGPYYKYIYQANAVIEGVAGSTGINAAVGKQLTGEAKFLRAFWYFYLINDNGDVPLVTSTNYTVNATLARTPKNEVYTQMIADLTDAKSLLNTNFVDISDTTITTERVRPTKSAASALLARVYLYTQKYDSAAAAATDVINNPLFSLVSDLNSVFLANSNEAIWQWQIPQPSYGVQTLDGNLFIVTGAANNGAGQSAISPWLLNSFEAGDLRKTNWLGSFVAPPDTTYYPFKYQVPIDNPTYNPTGRSEYTMALRLAEQYLIRSEAEAKLGDSASAIHDLNVIRFRAGLAGYSPANNGSLLAAILHERQVEFFAEWGHRWFDLIRTGNINTVMGAPGNICQQKGGVWAPYKALYPIPQLEIQDDVNLKQNPGY